MVPGLECLTLLVRHVLDDYVGGDGGAEREKL